MHRRRIFGRDNKTSHVYKNIGVHLNLDSNNFKIQFFLETAPGMNLAAIYNYRVLGAPGDFSRAGLSLCTLLLRSRDKNGEESIVKTLVLEN